jgi:hypothetical protein
MRTPEELITGHTPDISEYAHFSFFEWVRYKEQNAFPEPDIKLARWVGVAKDVGQAMTYWLLTKNCTVIAWSSIIQLQEYEKTDPIVIQQQENFMQCVLERRRLSVEFEEPFVTVEGDSDFADFTPEEEALIYKSPEMDDCTPEAFNEYLSAQEILPRP